VGAHFFSPAHVMPLLEIVRTQHTSKQVRQMMLQMTKHICRGQQLSWRVVFTSCVPCSD
jgi:3-hydroxyacyl-CoA dehydrogenase